MHNLNEHSVFGVYDVNAISVILKALHFPFLSVWINVLPVHDEPWGL